MWVLATPVLFFFGKDFFINAFKQAKHFSANMDTLVVSVLVLLISSAYSIRSMKSFGSKED